MVWRPFGGGCRKGEARRKAVDRRGSAEDRNLNEGRWLKRDVQEPRAAVERVAGNSEASPAVVPVAKRSLD